MDNTKNMTDDYCLSCGLATKTLSIPASDLRAFLSDYDIFLEDGECPWLDTLCDHCREILEKTLMKALYMIKYKYSKEVERVEEEI